MRVTYVGTPGDPDTITHRGITFTQGKAVTVPDDHPFATDFRDNPTFSVKGTPAPTESDADERALLVADLDLRKIAHADDASMDDLRKLVADALLADNA